MTRLKNLALFIFLGHTVGLFSVHSGAQLVVNVKNKGGDLLRESIQANTTQDTVTLEFQESDGTLVTQFIDFKNVSSVTLMIRYEGFINSRGFRP